MAFFLSLFSLRLVIYTSLKVRHFFAGSSMHHSACIAVDPLTVAHSSASPSYAFIKLDLFEAISLCIFAFDVNSQLSWRVCRMVVVIVVDAAFGPWLSVQCRLNRRDVRLHVHLLH